MSDTFSSVKEILKSKEFKKEAPKKVNLLIHKVLRDADKRVDDKQIQNKKKDAA